MYVVPFEYRTTTTKFERGHVVPLHLPSGKARPATRGALEKANRHHDKRRVYRPFLRTGHLFIR